MARNKPKKPKKGAVIDYEHPLSLSLIARYPFNELTGDRIGDISGNDLHGKAVNTGVVSPTSGWTQSENGGAFILDGNNDYIHCAYHCGATAPKIIYDITNRITVEAWVKTAAADGKGIVTRWAGAAHQSWMIWFYQNKVAFTILVGGVQKYALTTNTYTDNKWHQCVGIFDGANVRLYIDGGSSEIVTGHATTGPITTSDAPLIVGAYTPGSGGNLAGSVDLVGVWGRCFSRAEIEELFVDPCANFDDQLDLKTYYFPSSSSSQQATGGASMIIAGSIIKKTYKKGLGQYSLNSVGSIIKKTYKKGLGQYSLNSVGSIIKKTSMKRAGQYSLTSIGSITKKIVKFGLGQYSLNSVGSITKKIIKFGLGQGSMALAGSLIKKPIKVVGSGITSIIGSVSTVYTKMVRIIGLFWKMMTRR